MLLNEDESLEFRGTHQEECVMKAFLGAVSAVVLAFTVACSQSDAGITTAVKSKMAADDTVKAYKIDVDTQNKVVTLSGEVDTPAQREQAMSIARNTKGVADVIDQLRVNPTAATTGVDVTIDVTWMTRRGGHQRKGRGRHCRRARRRAPRRPPTQ